jgi:hypothetical protein
MEATHTSCFLPDIPEYSGTANGQRMHRVSFSFTMKHVGTRVTSSEFNTEVEDKPKTFDIASIRAATAEQPKSDCNLQLISAR